MEIDLNKLNTDEKTMDKIKKSLDDEMLNEYFVSIALRMKADNRDNICNMIHNMLIENGLNSGFEYTAMRVDGVEE